MTWENRYDYMYGRKNRIENNILIGSPACDTGIRSFFMADPLFVNPAGHDYRLQEGSPALGLGVEAIDTMPISLIPRLPHPV